MLVLSRRAQQQIVFEDLGITLSILQVHGRIVKIGIDVPPGVAVKGKAIDSEAEIPCDDGDLCGADSEHRRRNQMNTLQLYVDSIRMRLKRGEHVDIQKLVRSLLSAMNVENDVNWSTDISQTQHECTNNPRVLRVLVVEDCDNERGLLTCLLASHGFIVHVARDGAEAFEQLRHGCGLPDVVLMDVEMPFGNGIEALQRFRLDPSLNHLLIYAVTGSRRNSVDEPVGRGWDRWFPKPVNLRKLVDAIREDCSRADDAVANVIQNQHAPNTVKQ